MPAGRLAHYYLTPTDSSQKSLNCDGRAPPSIVTDIALYGPVFTKLMSHASSISECPKPGPMLGKRTQTPNRSILRIFHWTQRRTHEQLASTVRVDPERLLNFEVPPCFAGYFRNPENDSDRLNSSSRSLYYVMTQREYIKNWDKKHDHIFT